MKRNKKLSLSRETVKNLTAAQLVQIQGGQDNVSVIYDCPGNVSIVNSCFAQRCGPSGIYVCPM